MNSAFYEYNDFNLPSNLFFHSAVYVTPQNGKKMIYIFGGIELKTFKISKSVYIYDIQRNTLVKDSQSMNIELFGHSTVYLNNEICIIGGCNMKSDSLSTCHSFSLWKSIRKSMLKNQKQETNLPESRIYHSSIVIQDKIFISGGINITKGKEKILNDLWRFSFETGWGKIDVTPIIRRRFGHSIIVDGTSMVIFGGELDSNQIIPNDYLPLKDLINLKTKISELKPIEKTELLLNSPLSKMIFRKYVSYRNVIFSVGGINYSKFRILQDFLNGFYSNHVKFPLHTLKYITNTSNSNFKPDLDSIDDFFSSLVHYHDFVLLKLNSEKRKESFENSLTYIKDKVKKLKKLENRFSLKIENSNQYKDSRFKELLDILEDPYQIQMNVEIFLSTFLIDMTTKELIGFIMEQLKLSISSINEKNWQKKIFKVENISNFIKTWIIQYFEDFDDEIFIIFYNFLKEQYHLERVFEDIFILLNFSLKKLSIEELENTYSSSEQKNSKALLASPKLEIFDTEKYFENVNKEIINSDTYFMSNIKRKDFYSCLSNKSESIKRYEEYNLNLKSNFILLISNSEESKRKIIFKRLFDLQIELFHKNNFNATMIIYEVFNHQIIKELKVEKPLSIEKKQNEIKQNIESHLKKGFKDVKEHCVPPL